MKTKILSLFFLFFFLTINSQEYVSSGCYSDVVQNSASFSPDTYYSKIDIHFPSLINGEQKFRIVEFVFLLKQITLYGYGWDSNNCPNVRPNNQIAGMKTKVKIELYDNNQLVATPLAEKTYNYSGVNTEISTDLSNFSLPGDLPLSDKYKLKFTIQQIGLEGYLNPFDKEVVIETDNFTLGRGPEIIEPTTEAVSSLMPKIKWENLPNVNNEFRLIVGKEHNVSYNSSINNVQYEVFDSGIINANEITIPSGKLEPNILYQLYVIINFNGKYYSSSKLFRTPKVAPTINFTNLLKQKHSVVELNASSNSTGKITYEIIGNANGATLSASSLNLGESGAITLRANLEGDYQYLSSSKDITITIVNEQVTEIPDANFEQVLINLGYDTTIDSGVITNNIKNITNLVVNNSNIKSLKGIEDFTALNSLYATNNQIEEIDLSKNLNLTDINLFSNKLLKLKLKLNVNLNNLDCSYNEIAVLDLSNNQNIEALNVNNNKLTYLNLKNINNLPHGFNALHNNLNCIEVDDANYFNTNFSSNVDTGTTFSNNGCTYQTITISDVNLEKALIDLGYDTNGLNGNIYKHDALEITHLDISDPINNEKLPNVNAKIIDISPIYQFTKLQYLYASKNAITTVSLGYGFVQSQSIKYLDFSNNQISHFEGTPNSYDNLTYLNLAFNNLSQISFTFFASNLEELWLGENPLTTVRLSRHPKLKKLFIWNTPLTTLDVSTNRELTFFVVNRNVNLTSLDFSNAPWVENIHIYGNGLTSLTFANNLELKYLRLWDNLLTSLDVTSLTNLKELSVNGNPIVSLDLIQNINLEELRYGGNALINLDLRNGNNNKITYISDVGNSSPNLNCIKVDDVTYSYQNWINVGTNTSFVSDDVSCASYTETPIVTFDDLTKIYGEADFDLVANSNSTGVIQFETDNEEITLSGVNNKTVHINKVGYNGYANITAIIPANGNYKAARKTIKLTINKRDLTITADGKTKVYGDVDPAFTYQITSGSLINGDVVEGKLYNNQRNVGVHSILENITSSNKNYNITYIPENLTITKKNSDCYCRCKNQRVWRSRSIFDISNYFWKLGIFR